MVDSREPMILTTPLVIKFHGYWVGGMNSYGEYTFSNEIRTHRGVHSRLSWKFKDV